ncbi:MAG: hypothetical protein K0U41_08480 [Gammaproteobacteria bacterium]|nr:hypothetical protein [Gammaproteobacteria bacterium]
MASWLLVEPKENKDNTTTEGLILTTEDLQDVKVEYATILSIGPLCQQPFKIGDEIVYYKNDGNAVYLDGEIYKVVNELAILLINRS